MGITHELDASTEFTCGKTGNKLCFPATQLSKTDEKLSKLKLTNDQLLMVRDKLLERLNKCLDQKEQNGTAISALPTFVTALPDGTEKGTFLALDLGGTNFRIVKVDLPGMTDKKVQVHSQVYSLPSHIIASTAEEFFNHIAKCLADFISHLELEGQRLPLGFTFAFPCSQKGLNQAVLLRWTKGFNVSGVVGKDIVKLLEDAINHQIKKGLKCLVDVVVVINDTVGTLMSCAYEDKNCKLGMIVGTGTNACYMESTSSAESLDGSETLRRCQMCINTEWGSFGEDGSLDDIRTSFDYAVDYSSSSPGLMIFEKMISGLYLGDIVQEILKDLIREKTLFEGVLSEELETPHRFLSSFLTQIEREVEPRSSACGQILTNLGYPSAKPAECQIIRNVCQMVSERAGRLCAAGISALLARIRLTEKMDPSKILQLTVAVDGTLYKKHPTFKHIVSSTVRDLSPRCDVKFSISYDGGGKGAALSAAVTSRILTRTDKSNCCSTPSKGPTIFPAGHCFSVSKSDHSG